MNEFPWANRIFERFFILYGRQKTAAMFGINDDEIAIAKAAWESQLRQYSPDTIRHVLQTLANHTREWPPNLSEWNELCRQQKRAEDMLKVGALPAPKAEPTDYGRRMAKELLATLGADQDSLFWAKRPKTPLAVEYLANGAKKDSRLAEILQAHIETGGESCRSPEAKAAIMQRKTK
jgi:hypothetical protein